jgi:hypothetical protein
VVPPTSTTKAVSFRGPPLAQEAKKLAPRIEFVGPDENVLIGNLTAWSQVINVPSFDVRNKGQSSSSCCTESTNPATTWAAYERRDALRIVAFSLSSSPSVSGMSALRRGEGTYQCLLLPCLLIPRHLDIPFELSLELLLRAWR